MTTNQRLGLGERLRRRSVGNSDPGSVASPQSHVDDHRWSLPTPREAQERIDPVEAGRYQPRGLRSQKGGEERQQVGKAREKPIRSRHNGGGDQYTSQGGQFYCRLTLVLRVSPRSGQTDSNRTDLFQESPGYFLAASSETWARDPIMAPKMHLIAWQICWDGFSSVKHVKTGEVHGWPSIEKLYGSMRRVHESMQGDRSTLPRHAYRAQCVRSCLDCANHCLICCSDLRESSPLLVRSSQMCSWACELCALECSAHTGDLFVHCLTTCRLCADECHAVRRTLGDAALREHRTRMTHVPVLDRPGG